MVLHLPEADQKILDNISLIVKELNWFTNNVLSDKNKIKKVELGKYYGDKIDRSLRVIFNEKLSVVPITTHIKLKDVPKRLNKKMRILF